VTRYIVHRIAHLIGVLLLVTVGVSGLLQLMPGDPALIMLGTTATRADQVALDTQLGLNGSFPQQYWHWLDNAVHGNLGQSVITKEPVISAIGQGLPITLEIVVLGLIIALVLSVPLAGYCALRVGGRVDGAAAAVSSAALSIPSYIVGVALLYLLVVKWRVFPVGDWVPIGQDPAANLRAVFLPALVIALGPAAAFFRVLRTDMITTLEQDFILTARAKGLPTRYILFRHALRPSLFTLLTTAGLTVGGLIGGSFIVEDIFQLPGLGYLSVQAINNKDIPVIQGVAVITALVFVLANLAVDISYPLVDPRVGRS
jgi:peptide/nickel transport system permease protein